MSVYTYPPISIDTTGLATEAKQDLIITELESANTELQNINSELDTQTTSLALINSKDFSTEVTSAAILAELENKADLTETQPVSLASVPLPTGAATESAQTTAQTTLNELNARLGGSLAPVEHDELEITYVAAGNGAGEIETVLYKLSTITVTTLTLSYDASNRLVGVVKS